MRNAKRISGSAYLSPYHGFLERCLPPLRLASARGPHPSTLEDRIAVLTKAVAGLVSMAAPIAGIPVEILDRVFTFLDDDKQAISCSRLVCKDFEIACSKYLITRVLFAHRLGTIKRLLRIVEHPCFHKYITELLYDVSEYSQQVSNEWEQYVEHCARAPRVFDNDEDVLRRRKEDDFALSEVNKLIQRSQTLYSADTTERQRQLVVDDDGSGLVSLRPNNEEHQTTMDRGLRLGCHKGFLDYRELERMQGHINASCLPRRVLTIAFSKLPALRKVVLSDWRRLAHVRESYDACARRLFGNTLAPTSFIGCRDTLATALQNVLLACAKVPNATFNSLVIGPHAFEHPCIPTGRGPFRHSDPRDALHIPIESLFGMYQSDRNNLFRRLRYLSLSLSYTSWPVPLQETGEVSLFPNGMFEAARSLTRLRLHFREPPFATTTVTPGAADLSIKILTETHFPQLHALDLRRWVLPANHFSKFLRRHAANLRRLRLLGCILDGDSHYFAKWAAVRLTLTGVEMDATSSNRCPSYEAITKHRDKNLRISPELDTLTDEWEALWLDGRQNKMQRLQELEVLDDEDSVKWYLKPLQAYKKPN